MKTRNSAIALLILVCGSTVAAQETYRPPARQDQPVRSPIRDQAVRTAGLTPSEWAIGANVVSANTGETLGSIDDLAIKSPKGHITHAVITRGGVLGIGSKHIAVPWKALRWAPGDRSFSLPMTEDELRAAPEFDNNQWNVFSDPQWVQRTDDFFKVRPGDDRGGPTARGGDDHQAWMGGGQFQDLIQKGERATLRGKVDSVDRRAPMEGMSEGFVVTLRDQENQEHRVFLGPVWFIEHQAAQPRRGDQVEIQGMRVSINGRDAVVARTVSAPAGTLRLRDEQGRPAWDASTGDRTVVRGDQPGQPARPADQILATPEPRGGQGTYLQVSKIKGKDVVTAQGEDAGEVQSLVFDVNSGRAVFLTVSFGGFLGLGDTDVAVPWELFTIGADDKIVLRKAERETLRSAPRVEDDWETILNDPGFAQRVYQHFGLDTSWLRQQGGGGGNQRNDDPAKPSRRF